MDKFDLKKDLKEELIEGTRRCKKIICLRCNLMISNLPADATEQQRKIEAVGVGAHLEFSHDVKVFIGKCRDPKCKDIHLKAEKTWNL